MKNKFLNVTVLLMFTLLSAACAAQDTTNPETSLQIQLSLQMKVLPRGKQAEPKRHPPAV